MPIIRPEPLIPRLEEVREALSASYAIEREIGAGGMATVYLARDLKHDRQVAVKVLRGELTSTLGKERFPREIRVIAQLSHPHILPLHDSGEAGGFLYFVMPFVEGESLRARLEREGQLPI
ncbi:MAG TPA: protein kinase, partial [Gemmatimonadaceae bacterium]